jgi:hypothetical protein
MHCSPAGQVLQSLVLPHESVMMPHRTVDAVGLQVSAPQLETPPASLGPASLTAKHTLFTHVSPFGQPPQPMATPHESVPMTPHLPVHDGSWQLCEVPLPVQTWFFGQDVPHAIVVPLHGST